MKLIIQIILAFVVSYSSYASTENIVAIVNDTPITLKEFKNRRKFLEFVNNVQELNPQIEAHLNRTALKTLIDEQLFITEAKRLKIEISDNDINKSISKIEEANNMPKGQFLGNLRNHNISVETLKQQVKAQIIKERIGYMFAHSLKISKNEIDDFVSKSNKEKHYKLKKVTIEDSKDAEAFLKSLRMKVKGCNIEPKLLQDKATISDVTFSQKNIQAPLKDMIQKLAVGEVTDIIKENNKLSFYILCQKDLPQLSDNEYDYVANALVNKKVMVQIQKHYEKIRSKAYIKVFLK